MLRLAPQSTLRLRRGPRAPRGGIFARRGCGSGGRGSSDRGRASNRGRAAVSAGVAASDPSLEEVQQTLFQIGAEYGLSDDDDTTAGAGRVGQVDLSTTVVSKKRSINVKEMDSTRLRLYKQSRYELTKKQEHEAGRVFSDVRMVGHGCSAWRTLQALHPGKGQAFKQAFDNWLWF